VDSHPVPAYHLRFFEPAMTSPHPLIDIGANLVHESFAHDLDAVLHAAWQAGLEQIVVTGTSIPTSHASAELAAAHRNRLFSTAGIHPHEAIHFDAETLRELRALYQLPQVVAVGETGLDYNRNYSPAPNQEAVFAEQLALAVETQLPVFMHQRDAHERFLPILKEQRDHLSRAVVHCFTGTREELFDYLDLDLYIGVTGWICDERRGLELQELVKDIPPHRLMLETDAPYLQPRTIRPRPKHRRNLPEYLTWVLEQVALCTGRPAEEIARETTENARTFFALP
jgi:TatD DNase family protein